MSQVTFLKRVPTWASIVGRSDYVYRVLLVDIMIGALPVDLGLEKTRPAASRHDGDDRKICVVPMRDMSLECGGFKVCMIEKLKMDDKGWCKARPTCRHGMQ